MTPGKSLFLDQASLACRGGAIFSTSAGPQINRQVRGMKTLPKTICSEYEALSSAAIAMIQEECSKLRLYLLSGVSR